MDIDETGSGPQGLVPAPLPPPPTITTEPWTPARQQEGVRTAVVMMLVVATILAYGSIAVWVMAGGASLDDAAKLAGLLTPLVALTGGAVGFYFSK